MGTNSKPIEDYGLIGDGQTVALVARDGAIDWLCWPRFDSDACLAALLGTAENGTRQIAPTAKHETTRRYAGDDLVLVTEFACAGGAVLLLTDFMPICQGDDPAVVRRLEARGGAVDVAFKLQPMFGYGEAAGFDVHADGVVECRLSRRGEGLGTVALPAIAGSPERMRIMYRVDGGRQIEERDIALPGWGGAKPVRVGNAAAGQRQRDVYGEVIDSARLCQRAGIERTAKGRATAAALIRHVEKIWQEPDRGM